MDAPSLEALIIQSTTEPQLRDHLVEALIESKIAIPLDKGLENGALPADFKPLTLNAQQGYPVLATFTTPDKATPWIQQHPAFKHSLVTDFTWAVRLTRPPFGIAVNPGYKHAFTLSPAEVQALAEQLQPAT
jgi:hypothetical protein